MEQRIEEFIQEHHLLTFAASAQGEIWCASAFYAYNKEENSFVITSDKATKHIQLALQNNNIIAGNIALETEKIGMIRGLQFSARLIEITDNSFFNKYKALYLKRFPYAILKGGEIWVLEIVQAKFTDNRLGFGKKLYWRREDENSKTNI